MTLQQENGRWGEDLAVEYLVRNGMEILQRNWRFKHTEIDIIGKEGEVLVFIEVKTRAYTSFGRPEEMVDEHKRQILIHAASIYAMQIDHDWEIRFDIVGIIGQPGRVEEIQHFKDAFYPGMNQMS